MTLWSLRALARFAILGCTLAIEGYFFHVFAIRYVSVELDDDESKAARVYTCLTLVLFLQVMSIVSLFSLSWSNPGFVSDYFVSRKVPQ